MATHETGEYAVEDVDTRSLHTHQESDEHHHNDEESQRRKAAAEPPSSLRPKTEETKIAPPRDGAEIAVQGKDDKYALQDQTNLLPVKQVIVIFCGLNCALFCSLLEQTM